MASKKILILGGSSYIGRRLFEKLDSEHCLATYNNTPIAGGVPFDSLTMRLSDIVDDPDAFSHAIILLGDTNPETCAADPKASQALNVDSIKRVIQDLKVWHIKPIFTSSEFVFDGIKGNYVETDPVSPTLLYGRQKVDVEIYLQETCPDTCILRLAKVFGSELDDGTLFTGWLAALKEHQTIRCATDQIFSPVYREDVVESLIRVVDRTVSGLYHLSGPQSLTRMAFLEMLLKHLKVFRNIEVDVEPCSILDFDLREKRPLNVSMIANKLEQVIDYSMTDPDVVCKNIVEDTFSE